MTDITPENPLSLNRSDSLNKAIPMSPSSDYPSTPSITVEGPRALAFPEDCLVTFRVHRGQVVARSASRGQPASASVELQLIEVCCVEECEPEDKPAAPENDPIDRLFEQALEKPDEDEDEDEEETE